MRDILAGEFSRVLTTVVIYLVRSAWNFHMLYQTLCIIFKTSVTKFVILNDCFYIHCWSQLYTRQSLIFAENIDHENETKKKNTNFFMSKTNLKLTYF